MSKLGHYAAGIFLGVGIIDSQVFKDIGTEFGASGGSPAGSTTLGGLILVVVDVLLLVAGSIAVIFLIIGGYRYVMAHGNEEATEAAKKTLTSAILGLVIIALSFAIVTIISTVLLQGKAGLNITS